jgi:hypothetical protein
MLRETQANDPAQVREIDNLADLMRSIVMASDVTRTRERTSMELQPLTKASGTLNYKICADAKDV